MNKRGIFLISLVLIALCLTSFLEFKENVPNLIRLHVIANSNSPEDQMLKYKVRDQVIGTMKEKFEHSRNLDESREILLKSVPLLIKEAEITLKEAGSFDKVQAFYGQYAFPTKYYGQFSLPAGEYEALRLVIGEGEGENWWCVLFPPLCFVDGSKTDVQEEIKEEITENIIKQKTIHIKPAFKVVEIWKNITQKD